MCPNIVHHQNRPINCNIAELTIFTLEIQLDTVATFLNAALDLAVATSLLQAQLVDILAEGAVHAIYDL